jgi:hypothetical protein
MLGVRGRETLAKINSEADHNHWAFRLNVVHLGIQTEEHTLCIDL